MGHRLRITTEDTRRSTTSWHLDFTEDLQPQLDVVLREVLTLPASWSATRYETDLLDLAWSSCGSRDQLSAMLHGCQQHGWPFVAYAHARAQDEPSRWSAAYAATYLGSWVDRHAFAQEIAASGAHFIEGDTVGRLEPHTVDEICSGFLCLDVDGEVVVFDETPYG